MEAASNPGCKLHGEWGPAPRRLGEEVTGQWRGVLSDQFFSKVVQWVPLGLTITSLSLSA